MDRTRGLQQPHKSPDFTCYYFAVRSWHDRQIIWLIIIKMRITFQRVYSAPCVRFSLHYSSRYIESSAHTSQKMHNVSIRQTNLLIFYCGIPLRCADLPFGILWSIHMQRLVAVSSSFSLQEMQRITKRKHQPKIERERIKVYQKPNKTC
jgi:hypothetical protein